MPNQDYNTENKNDNSNKDDNSPKSGFYRGFSLRGHNTGSYEMGKEKYEKRIRKRIIDLKAEKKQVSEKKRREEIEQEILFLNDRLLSKTDTAVYEYLVARVSTENIVNMNKARKNQKAIAEELYLERTNVSKAFRKLKELHVINYKLSGNSFEKIEISPRIIWKGNKGNGWKHYSLIHDLDQSFGIFSRDPFEVDPDYLKPPEKTA